MKQQFTTLAALTLALSLVLALLPVGVAEADITLENVTIEDGTILLTEGEEAPVEINADALLAPLAEEPEFTTPQMEAVDGEVASNTLPTKLTIGVGETYTIKGTALGKRLTYSSSKTKVATVSKKGVVTGKKAGTSKITVKGNGGKNATIIVTVKKAPDKVSFAKTNASLETGDTLKLKARLPKNTASYKLIWRSSNKTVATVDSKGKITAVGAGTAKITVTTFNKKKATCKVTVKKKPIVSVDTTTLTLNEGETGTILVTFYGAGSVYWHTSDTSIAQPSWSNEWNNHTTVLYIKAGKVGTAVVSVYDGNTNETVYIDVTVIGPTVEISLPYTPITLSNYSSYRGLEQQFDITEITYDAKKRSDGTFTVYLNFAGTKTYDYRGEYQSARAYVSWKLYNSNDAIADSGSVLTPSVAMHESWSAESCHDYIFDLPAGEYTLKLLDTN